MSAGQNDARAAGAATGIEETTDETPRGAASFCSIPGLGAQELIDDAVTFHALAQAFPLLEGQPFADLVADIAEHGVREPVWMCDGQILDGRNRWRAARVAGVECPTRQYEGDAPAAFVVSLNLHRRHLSDSQRAMVAAKLATMSQGARTDLASIGAMSQPEAAGLLNVSRSAVQRARNVVDDGAPALVAAVESGAVSVSAAAEVATLGPDVQAEIVAAGPVTVQQAAKTVRALRVAHSGDGSACVDTAEARRRVNADIRASLLSGCPRHRPGEPVMRVAPVGNDGTIDPALAPADLVARALNSIAAFVLAMSTAERDDLCRRVVLLCKRELP